MLFFLYSYVPWWMVLREWIWRRSLRKIPAHKFLWSIFSVLQAEAALMYDAVSVLVEGLSKILRKKPDQFRSYTMRRPGVSTQPTFGNMTLGIGATTAGAMTNLNGNDATPRPLDCNTAKGWVTPWEHGDRISRYLRKVSTTVAAMTCTCNKLRYSNKS